MKLSDLVFAEVLGRGAHGTVRKATLDGRLVAVKDMPLVHPEGKTVELAHREARVLAELDHPRVVRAIDCFTEGGRIYLVQELVEGLTLADEARSRRYEADEVLVIVEELAEVLEYLHSRSPPVIHRDLKPSNVVRTEAGLVLIDFGSVRDALRDPELGGSTVAGTFGFMAPEQLRGDASPATDIYGLAALAVALLSRKDPARLMDWSGAMRWGTEIEVHHAVRALLTRMLTPDPAARPSDARALRLEVAALREALRTGVGLPTPRPEAGSKGLLAIVAAGAVLAAGVTSFLWVSTNAPDPMAPTVATTVIEKPPEEPSEERVSETETPTMVTTPDGQLLPVLTFAEVEALVEQQLTSMSTAAMAYEAAFDTFPPSALDAGLKLKGQARYYLACAMNGLELLVLVTRGPERGRLFTTGPGSTLEPTELDRLDDVAILNFLDADGVVGNRDDWWPEDSARTGEERVAVEHGTLVPQLDEAGTLRCVYDELRALEKALLGYDAAFDEFTSSFHDLGFQPDSTCAHYVAVEVTQLGVLSRDVVVGATVLRGPAKGRRFELGLGGDVVEAD